MGSSKQRYSGNTLRVIAHMAESSLLGNAVKGKMMRQMGLDKVWTASISEDEPPVLVPAYLMEKTNSEEGGNES